MPAVLGNVIVIGVLLCAVSLVIRSLWKSHRDGSGCCGDCSQCGGCGGGGRRQDGGNQGKDN